MSDNIAALRARYKSLGNECRALREELDGKPFEGHWEEDFKFMCENAWWGMHFQPLSKNPKPENWVKAAERITSELRTRVAVREERKQNEAICREKGHDMKVYKRSPRGHVFKRCSRCGHEERGFSRSL